MLKEQDVQVNDTTKVEQGYAADLKNMCAAVIIDI